MVTRKEVTKEEMRTIQLDILDKIHDYCEKNHLRYSLCGGTLLGAVRHQGYIPWDDDIDIMMPRPDYEKFMVEFNDKHEYLVTQNFKNSKTFYYDFGKVYDNRTIIKEKDRCLTGVYVDIFPIDGMPDSQEETSEIITKCISIIEDLKKTTQYYKFNNGHFLRVKYLLKLLICPSRKKTIERYYELINKYPFGGKKYSGVLMGQYGLKEKLPSKLYSSYTNLMFEGKSYRVMGGYTSYLSSLYGDYMQLPPIEKRKSMHIGKAYWK